MIVLSGFGVTDAQAARRHAEGQGLGIDYRVGLVEDLAGPYRGAGVQRVAAAFAQGRGWPLLFFALWSLIHAA